MSIRYVSKESLLALERICDDCEGVIDTDAPICKGCDSTGIQLDERRENPEQRAMIDSLTGEIAAGVKALLHEQDRIHKRLIEQRDEARERLAMVDGMRASTAAELEYTKRDLDEAREDLARIQVALALEDLILIQKETRK